MFIDFVYDLYLNPRHPCTWSACAKRLEHERRDEYNTIYRQIEFTLYVSDNKKQTISEVDDSRNHFHRFLSAIRDAVCLKPQCLETHQWRAWIPFVEQQETCSRFSRFPTHRGGYVGDRKQISSFCPRKATPEEKSRICSLPTRRTSVFCVQLILTPVNVILYC